MKKILSSFILFLIVGALLLTTCACGGESEKSYKELEKEALESVIDRLPFASRYENGSAIKSTMSINASNSVLMLLAASGIDPSWINHTSFTFVSEMKNDANRIASALAYKGSELLSLEAIIAPDGNTFITIPQLAQQYLSRPNSEEMATVMSSLSSSLSYYETAFSLLKKHALPLLESLPDAVRSEGSITANGKTQNCIVYTLELTAKDLTQLLRTFLANLAADEALKNIMNGLVFNATTTDFSAEDMYEELISEINELVIEIDHSLANDPEELLNSVVFSMDTFVSNNTIIGRDIRCIDPNNDSTPFTYFYGNATQSGATGIEASLLVDGVKLLSAKGTSSDGKYNSTISIFDSATRTNVAELVIESNEKSGMLSGTVLANIQGMSVLEISFDNVNKKELDKGYFNGHASLTLGDDAMNMLNIPMNGVALAGLPLASLSLDFDVQMNASVSVITTSLVNGEEKLISLTVKSEVTKASDFAIPSGTQVTEDPEAWAANLNPQSILAYLKQTELPSSVVDLISALLLGSF